MEDILQLISNAGIKTDAEKQPDIHAAPSYRGNFGFYHIISEGWETLIVKGVFKGNIRRISGECPFDDRKLNELAQTLSDVERCLRRPAKTHLYNNEGTFYVCSAEALDYTPLPPDARDFEIKSPLTPVEESLGRSSGTNEKHLFIKSPFASLLNETISPYAFSIIEAMPDVLSPLFMSADIKTLSPSVKPFFCRILMNCANIETILSAFYAKADFFYLNYLPSIYKTIKKPSFDVPKVSSLHLADGELANTIEDIERTADDMTGNSLFSNEFFEIPALSVMAWEIAAIGIWHAFTEFMKSTGLGHEDAMRHIYKTRAGGLLRFEGAIMPVLDPAAKPVVLKPLDIPCESSEATYAKLPSMKRLVLSKGKYSALLTVCHKALDDTDKVYLTLSKLIMKMRETLLETGRNLVENRVLTDENDIFFFEHKEIQNIVADSFYGNVPFTLNFRRWQSSRFASVCLPGYLYEKDVENYKDIAEKQIKKSETEKTIPCMAFFHKQLETDNFVCRHGFSITDIKDAQKADIVIAEGASLFSYIAQFCAATDKPLYTGARFAPLLTTGKKIKTGNDFLTMI